MPTYCTFESCQKRASFGVANTKIPFYCATHKKADSINVKDKTCIHPGCHKMANYGLKDTKLKLYCATHKPENYVNIGKIHCIFDGCSTIPSFGDPEIRKASYCAAHKPIHYIDVISKSCIDVNCNKQSAYGLLGSRIPIYCAEHKPESYINVREKTCAHINCRVKPNYGLLGTRKAIYCVTHKPSHFIDVISKTCMYIDCNKQPSYGLLGTKVPIYCTVHKPEGYINVRCKTCVHTNCSALASYGIFNTKDALYCYAHKPENYVNVLIKLCDHPECNTTAHYGLLGNLMTSCAKHKTPEMILKPRKRCTECKELGIYGTIDSRRCELHKKQTDKNLLNKNCISCGLEMVINADGYCQSCGEFPIVKRAYLEKQNFVKEALIKEFVVESYDKQLDGGVCSKKRPDFVIDGLYRKIVVEVDEHQHKRGRSYQPECEIIRMWEITQALGMPTIFIRFNPDVYRDHTGKRINLPISSRIDSLISWIRTLIERKPQDGTFLSVLYLYYDGFIRSEDAVEEHQEDPLSKFAVEELQLTDEDLDWMLSELEV